MADDIKNNIPEEEEASIIVLEDDLGNEVEFEYLDVIEYEGIEYLYLIPANEDDGDDVKAAQQKDLLVHLQDAAAVDQLQSPDGREAQGDEDGEIAQNVGDLVPAQMLPEQVVDGHVKLGKAHLRPLGAHGRHVHRLDQQDEQQKQAEAHGRCDKLFLHISLFPGRRPFFSLCDTPILYSFAEKRQAPS